MPEKIELLLGKMEEVVSLVSDVILKQQEQDIMLGNNTKAIKDMCEKYENGEAALRELIGDKAKLNEEQHNLIKGNVEACCSSSRSSYNRVFTFLFIILIPMFGGVWGYSFNQDKTIQDIQLAQTRLSTIYTQDSLHTQLLPNNLKIVGELNE
jgi:hypothetical protein